MALAGLVVVVMLAVVAGGLGVVGIALALHRHRSRLGRPGAWLVRKWRSRRLPAVVWAIRLRCRHYAVVLFPDGQQNAKTSCPTCGFRDEVKRP